MTDQWTIFTWIPLKLIKFYGRTICRVWAHVVHMHSPEWGQTSLLFCFRAVFPCHLQGWWWAHKVLGISMDPAPFTSLLSQLEFAHLVLHFVCCYRNIWYVRPWRAYSLFVCKRYSKCRGTGRVCGMQSRVGQGENRLMQEQVTLSENINFIVESTE